MCLRRRFIEQTGIGKILNGHVSFRIGNAEFPAIDVTLTRLGLDAFTIELESSAHMRAIIPACRVWFQRTCEDARRARISAAPWTPTPPCCPPRPTQRR